MKKSSINRFLFVILITQFLLCIPAVVSAQDTSSERILLFKSEITINDDSTMDVTEWIIVRCEGKTIRHGIFRDFPTTYEDEYGNKVKVGFYVKEVLRNGFPEPYSVENRGNGKRVVIGDSIVLLITNAVHTYTIKYRTNRQLGFLKDHDELYWNVTGNGWIYYIDRVEATVRLPAGIQASDIVLDAYTGAQGEKGKEFSSAIVPETSDVLFATKSCLRPFNGLTICVSFPKGFVKEPTRNDKIKYMLMDNLAYISGIAGLLLTIVYYLIVWVRVGKDIPRGPIIPLYQPPDNLSPGAVRYIRQMGMDNDVMAAAVINMAVKGFLKIVEYDSEYRVEKTGKNVNMHAYGLSDDETAIAKAVFKFSDAFEMRRESYLTTNRGKTAQRKSLAKNYLNKYFITNTKYMLLGITISLLASVGIPISISINSLSTAGFTFLAITGIVLVILHILFYHLLKAPTHEGRRLIDLIEGFKMYLEVTEKERMNLQNQPVENLQLYEKYLPYAMALGIENKWNIRFESVLKNMASEGSEYTPSWFSFKSGIPYAFGSGSGSGGVASSIASSVSHAISSSSRSGQRSGSMGGGLSGGSGGGGSGSSGGGRGGGGGGGW